jgi:hypothetical protein
MELYIAILIAAAVFGWIGYAVADYNGDCYLKSQSDRYEAILAEERHFRRDQAIKIAEALCVLKSDNHYPKIAPVIDILERP